MKKLIIAEKPSVGNEIAKVLGLKGRKDGYIEGEKYIVSWCIGHLVTLALPDEYNEKYKQRNTKDLPIFPETWKYRLMENTKGQFNILKKLMDREDVTELISATDAGREGELIFKLVYDYAKCKKPFKRLWINSMEEKAIKKGFENLLDSSAKKNLTDASVCRAKADWLIGMNMSRLFMTSIGRVKTPTLALVVNREKAIKDFVSSYSYTVSLFKNDLEFTSNKLENEEQANELQTLTNNQNGKIIEVIQKETKSNPPKLFDLVSLQRESNKLFSLSAKETLSILQKLYEEKILTYPRTDSQFITKDMEQSTNEILLKVFNLKKLSNFTIGNYDISKIVNDEKVSDHHAILPTLDISEEKIKSLSKKEKDILFLVCARLIIAVSPHELSRVSTIKISCKDDEFILKHNQTLEMGYKTLEETYQEFVTGKKKTKEKEKIKLPEFNNDEVIENMNSKVNKIKATPPKTFTEDTLLSAMEHAGNEFVDENTEKKGIGTPATMGNVIDELISKNKFLQRKGKQIIPTQNGENLITLLPETLTSPKMTADWEIFLQQIEKGNSSKEDFLNDVMDFINRQVVSFEELTDEQRKLIPKRKESFELLGLCPKCKKNQVVISEKVYFCEDKEKCNFVLFKNSKFFETSKKTFTQTMAKNLIENGRISVKGLTSKAGKKYDADIILDIDHEKGYGNFKLEFTTKKKKN